jgi:hypothetical protein
MVPFFLRGIVSMRSGLLGFGLRPAHNPTKEMLRFHEAIRRGRLARRTLSGQDRYGYGLFALLGPTGYENVVHNEAGFDRVAL